MLRFLQIMNKRKPTLAKLINPQLINDSTDRKGDIKVLASKASTTSQYFSPKKIRNKIKIEYDERTSKLKPASAGETEVKKPKEEPENCNSVFADETKIQNSKAEPQNWQPTEVSSDQSKVKKPKEKPKKLIQIVAELNADKRDDKKRMGKAKSTNSTVTKPSANESAKGNYKGKSKHSKPAAGEPKLDVNEVKKPKAETDNGYPTVAEASGVETNDKKPKREPKISNPTVPEASEDETEVKKPKWEPKNWIQTLQNMRKMRQDQKAPVDTMGCHKCYDHQADEKTKRYHILVALMLSSQTKDQTTYDAMNRLKEHGLTPENIIKSDAGTLEKLIAPVSFYKNKTKYLQKASQILIDQHSSDIPSNIEGLLKLPGVGPKMAHICMNSAWNIVTGIGVDTHVHRITNRLKWVEKPTKEPEQTRMALEKWLPFEYWTEVNEMMVGFGQTICTPINPKCHECLNIECPSRNVKK